MEQNNTVKPSPSMGFSISEFIDGQLGMLSRRMTPEERAQVKWWRERISILAKQEPAAEPIETAKAA